MISRLEEVCGRSVSRETFEKLEAYGALLIEESSNQNLIAASTIDHLWDRLRVRWNSPNIMFGWYEHLLMAISLSKISL